MRSCDAEAVMQKPPAVRRGPLISQFAMSLVALARIARELIANSRIRIGANAVAADIVHAVRPASRRPHWPIAAIRSSGVGAIRVACGVRVTHLAILSVLGERRRCDDGRDTR